MKSMIRGLAAGVLATATAASAGMVSYQGRVELGGSAYSGPGYFKLAVVDTAGTTTSWSNDGTSTGGAEPAGAVTLGVSNGLFEVLLGDTSLPGMTDLPAAAFPPGQARFLRLWFSTTGTAGSFVLLSPDRRVASVPFALQAEAAVTADSAAGFTGPLSGDVTGLQAATVVAAVGGKSAAAVAASVTDTESATTASTPSTLVRRDAAGAIAGTTNTSVAFGVDGTLSVTDAGGTKTTTAGSWLVGGDSLTSTGLLGTLSNNHVDLVSNNLVRGRLTNLGEFFVGTTGTTIAGDLMGAVSRVTFPWAVNGYSSFNGGGVYGAILAGTTVYAGVQGENNATATGAINAAGVRGVYSGSSTGTGFRLLAATGPEMGVSGAVNTQTAAYAFGVHGSSPGVTARTGAVFGDEGGFAQGALGYLASTNLDYSVYGFSQAYQAGTLPGRLPGTTSAGGSSTHIGIGLSGGVLGGWIRGQVHGLHLRGERSSLYVDGLSVANQPAVQLVDTGQAQRAVTYAVSSPTPDVYARGRATLGKGRAVVAVPESFRRAASKSRSLRAADADVVVTASPLGESKGIYVAQLLDDGFEIRENGGGESDVAFSWIAIARRADVTASVPSEVLASDFDARMSQVTRSEGSSEPALPIWWDGTRVRFDAPERPTLPASLQTVVPLRPRETPAP